jgi:hypothetical protein
MQHYGLKIILRSGEQNVLHRGAKIAGLFGNIGSRKNQQSGRSLALVSVAISGARDLFRYEASPLPFLEHTKAIEANGSEEVVLEEG